jgi:hypothetical protein
MRRQDCVVACGGLTLRSGLGFLWLGGPVDLRLPVCAGVDDELLACVVDVRGAAELLGVGDSEAVQCAANSGSDTTPASGVTAR